MKIKETTIVETSLTTKETEAALALFIKNRLASVTTPTGMPTANTPFPPSQKTEKIVVVGSVAADSVSVIVTTTRTIDA